MRTFAATAALVLLLSACSGGDDVPGTASDETTTPGSATTETAATTTLESEDGTVAIQVPEDWTVTEDLPDAIAVAATGPDPVQQVAVTAFDGVDEAATRAETSASALADEDIACEQTELDGHALHDCPEEQEGEVIRRLLVPVQSGERSAVVLVQTPADDLAQAGELALPIVESLTLD